MESTQLSKTDELAKQIAILEIEYAAVKEEVRTSENKEKLKLHEKSMMEVKVDRFKTRLKLYRNKAEEMRYQLKKETARHSRLSFAEQYYEKYLANPPEDCVLQTRESVADKDREICWNLKKQIEEMEKEIEFYRQIINEKNVRLLSLSDEMGVNY